MCWGSTSQKVKVNVSRLCQFSTGVPEILPPVFSSGTCKPLAQASGADPPFWFCVFPVMNARTVETTRRLGILEARKSPDPVISALVELLDHAKWFGFKVVRSVCWAVLEPQYSCLNRVSTYIVNGNLRRACAMFRCFCHPLVIWITSGISLLLILSQPVVLQRGKGVGEGPAETENEQ